ncbi:MAG: ATP-dependent Clp protease proteolytic subunit [Candidatus Brennerbacteria bacterium]|nr:ATP-dependent Clp protease proteolytic subunit [Candidatus Brennerbacteria bacterium]
MIDEDLEKVFSLVLLEQRKIYLEGRIDDQQADKIAKMVLWLNAKYPNQEIFLYINSKGGNVGAGFDLYDIIKYSESLITGTVFKEANSMAILVLQACHRRKMMRHSTMFFHNFEITLGMDWKKFEEESKKRIAENQKSQEDYESIIAGRSGMKIEEVNRLCEEKRNLAADEALRLGLVDEIL